MSIFPSDTCENLTPHSIGRIFTPLEWAKWACTRFSVYDMWRSGASIFDPTCGDGAFFRALFSISRDRDEPIEEKDLGRLYGVEINPGDKLHFLRTVSNEVGIGFPEENFVVCDFLNYEGPFRFDVAVGNPPWINFANLPDGYKDILKVDYVKYRLVRNLRDVLLGSSRIDLASLIIEKCMADHVEPNGHGYFFIPLSLLFNESANKYFRPSKGERNTFSVSEIVEFSKGMVFEDVGTRNGFVSLRRVKTQEFPVPLVKFSKNGNEDISFCHSIFDHGAWMQTESRSEPKSLDPVSIETDQTPRQGMNTGGLNKVFVLERVSDSNHPLEPIELFRNGYGEEISISTEFVMPLMDVELFGGKPRAKKRYILCLHDITGQAIPEDKLHDLEGIWDYLSKYRDAILSRKGVLLRSQMSKGRFWTLIGVGPYSFSSYKVAWEALGKRNFNAVVLDGIWQGNQSMHAYIPSRSKDDARRICSELNEIVPKYLRHFGMEGTCNWAQPGRIKRLLRKEVRVQYQKELF